MMGNMKQGHLQHEKQHDAIDQCLHVWQVPSERASTAELACFNLVQVVLVGPAHHLASKNLTYLHSKGTSERVKPVSHWVVVDLATERGRALAGGSCH